MNKYMEMKTFCAVVENGSFIKASEALSLSKTATSRYISDLEARLNVQLLFRSTRRISLTESGEIFYSKCRRLLFEIHEAESEAVSNSAEHNSKIRINAPVSLGMKYLAKTWGLFYKKNPDITLDVILSNRLPDLDDNDFDLAIRIGCPPKSTYSTIKLFTTHLVLCASPDYLNQRGIPGTPRELTSHDTISSSYWLTGNEWVFNGIKGSLPVTINPWIQSNNSDTCVSLALGGHGVIWQPEFMVASEISRGELIQLLPEYSNIDIGVYALLPKKRHTSENTKTLLDFLTEDLKNTATA